MKKALIIIPYFGSLPVWFQFFINSCESRLIDFLLVTNDRRSYDYLPNFQVVYKEYNHFKDFFKEQLGTNVYLEHPYKLCDYKPAYGKVFHHDIVNYEYWGYCDIDLTFGDIDNLLTPFFEEGFDKFSRFGHFSLYKNSVENNSLFLTENGEVSFEFVAKTSIPCLYDEIAINTIFKKSGKKLIDSQLFHNVNMNFKNFAVGNGLPVNPQLILKKGKKLFLAEMSEGVITYDEFFYIHIMRRNNIPAANFISEYVITVDGFKPFQDHMLLELFHKYGLPAELSQERLYKKQLRSAELKSKYQKLKR